MAKSISSQLAILISSLVAILQVTTTAELGRPFSKGFRPHWLSSEPRNHRNELFKKWLENKGSSTSTGSRSFPLPLDALYPVHEFKGCIDPSEPFQCPQSERCIALQFVCDNHPGDCPDNLDENEETCIAAKRPAKENIEKFLHAEYTLYGTKLFTFLFGEKLAKSIEENKTFWLDALASALSVAKNSRRFAEKTYMSSEDLAHFQKIIQIIYEGRLEEIPMFAQEAVNQGLGSLIEKLYESGFMEQ